MLRYGRISISRVRDERMTVLPSSPPVWRCECVLFLWDNSNYLETHTAFLRIAM